MTQPRPMACPIVLACDEAYAMPLAVTLRSAVESNRSNWPLEFHVLADGISEATRTRVLDSLPESSATIRWVTVDLNLFGEFSTQAHISKATYARLLIPRVFPETVSRILFLDTDILVLGDLASLWNTDMEDAVLGAVVDGMDAHLQRGAPGLEAMPRVREYFNAGVLLIDLDRWRAERISDKALEYLKQHSQSPFSDQDALNVACDKRWKKLDSLWNLQNHHEKNLAALTSDQRPRIVHFVTNSKPWLPKCRSINAGFYDSFRSRTCFARDPFEKMKDALRRFWAGCNNVLGRRVAKPSPYRQVLRQ